LVSVLIEAGGLLLIWLAPAQISGVVGALLTGLGFALVYPGLGVEAVRRAPPESRGLAMGAYTAFLDVALGLGSPALGWIAGWSGLGSVFLTGALIVFGATAFAVRLLCLGPSADSE
jgi:predicted MFS family arabinose efflux permease